MSAIVNDITKQFRAADELPLESQLATKLDYALTYATTGINSILAFLAFRIAYQNFEPIGFAEYALTRRALTFLLPLLSLGTTVAIAKFVATAASERRSNSSIHYLIGGLIVTLISLSTYGLATACLPSHLAYVCLGTGDRTSLVTNLMPFLGGLVLVNCCSAYCRGRLQVGASNLLQLICIGCIPCGALLLTNDIDQFLLWAGGAICAVGIASCTILYLGSSGEVRESHWSAARSLLRFGLPRVPGDLAFYGLFVVPAMVVAHRSNVQSAGEVAYAFAWLTILSQLVSPIGFLLLPEAAYLIRTGRVHVLRKRLCKLLPAFALVTSFLAVGLACWSRQLVELHLGTCTESLLRDVRLLIWTAIPLNFFILVRSVIDAAESHAVSPALCVVALLTFWAVLAGVSGHGDAATDVIYAFIAAMCVLAFMGGIAAWFGLRNPASLDDLSIVPTER